MKPYGNILIIDNEEPIRSECVRILAGAGYRVRAVGTGEEGIEACRNEAFDLVLVDQVLPGISGMDVLKKLKQQSGLIEVIIISGVATIETAVAAMKLGAADLITKPFSDGALTAAVASAIKRKLSSIQEVYALEALEENLIGESMIGRSDAMRRVNLLIGKVASMDSTVLITGETGSGKELVARTIHGLSDRRTKPFVTVDCGSLVETLFESEMFGHVKGAYTGAAETTDGKFHMANGGTIFLDEISNISVNMQARLLRVIQEREISRVGSKRFEKIDVRIIAATNRNLIDEIKNGKFREDLYYRLNVFQIRVPPLRERIDDIPLLADYFVKAFCRKTKRPVPEITGEALRFLKIHSWPGNVRELKNVIERAVILCENNLISENDLKIETENTAAEQQPPSSGNLKDIEREQIIAALTRFNGHRSLTAQYLGINRKTLREKMIRYNINFPKSRKVD